jgi:NAD(P)H-dependent FMN reductase
VHRVQHSAGGVGDNAYRSRTASPPATVLIVGVNAVPLQILVLYGSYRSDRKGIRLAHWICEEIRSRGDAAELIDAKTVGLPIMDRMYKEYAPGEAPVQMKALATKIREADAFAFVVGEYNWGVQPGLKNLTDHFLEEWFWRPAAIASYSAGRTSGVRAALAWRSTLSEMGMVVVSSTLAVGPIEEALDVHGRPTVEHGRLLGAALTQFLEDLAWWAEAAKAQRAGREPPY